MSQGSSTAAVVALLGLVALWIWALRFGWLWTGVVFGLAGVAALLALLGSS